MDRIRGAFRKLGGLVIVCWGMMWIVFGLIVFPDFMNYWNGVWLGISAEYAFRSKDLEYVLVFTMLSLSPTWALLSMMGIGIAVIWLSLTRFVLPNSRKRPVVAIAGGFDPLNGRGHMTHITEAMKLGKWLVVILSRDDQLIEKKGKTFYPDYEDRRLILEAMVKGRGEVVMNIDEGGTCSETLRKVKPQIFAKGGDRTPDNMPQDEIDVCREIGCRIVYNVGIPKTTSSQELVRRAVNEKKKGDDDPCG